jgi:hypothetical protein
MRDQKSDRRRRQTACATIPTTEYIESSTAANQFADDTDGHAAPALEVLADPLPYTGERTLARYGLLTEAEPVFTQGALLPLVGLWLALAVGGAAGGVHRHLWPVAQRVLRVGTGAGLSESPSLGALWCQNACRPASVRSG